MKQELRKQKPSLPNLANLRRVNQCTPDEIKILFEKSTEFAESARLLRWDSDTRYYTEEVVGCFNNSVEYVCHGPFEQVHLKLADYGGVCTATHDRQDAVRRFVAENPGAGVLVVGSAKSANTARLVKIAENGGAKTWRVSSPEEVSRLEFGTLDVLGITSGASTPEPLFRAVVSSF